jgi:hypothetical protein
MGPRAGAKQDEADKRREVLTLILSKTVASPYPRFTFCSFSY